MSNTYEIVWGIDVSKEWLDISIDNKVNRIEQTKRNINQFIKENQLKGKSTLAVVENTGGYEALVVECLDKAGVIVHVAHPNKVRNYAKARGKLAKTDKLDARIIEGYGRFIEEKAIRSLPTGLERQLSLLSTRFSQLKDLRQQEICRLGLAKDTFIKRSHQKVLAVLDKQLEQVKSELLFIIRSDVKLKQKYELLKSMKGVGEMVAIALIADLPELGRASKKEIAALVGVAPLTNESGKHKGKATTQGGREALRKVLYMGALVASRYNEKLKVFYHRLLAKGKLKKVALVAVMRKMIVILNAMVQSNTVFNA